MPVIPYNIMPATGSDQADEWMRLGFEAQTAGNLPLAQQRYNQCLRLDPRHALAMNNLAVVFVQSNLLNEGLLTIERAAMCDGVHSVIQRNWALMAMDSERPDEAMEHARKACAIDPDDVSNHVALSMFSTAHGTPEVAIETYNRVLDKEPTHPAAGPNACFVQTLTDSTAEDLYRQRKRWWEANRFKGTPAPHANDKRTDRPLRVGYVGGDFKSHSASFIFGRVLLHHTPNVEMYLYSTLPVEPGTDAMSKRFQDASPGRWRDISAIDDEKADELIRSDRIDILVDLAAHTNGGRLALFTRKPVQVQVTAWGFAHGTGCPEIDYFFADPVAVPEEDRKHYAEKIYDLPCLVTMEEPSHYNLKGTSLPPIRKNGYFTFGSYARYEKMSDDCLRSFAEILRRVPDSKLELKDGAYRRPFSIKRVMSFMEGIEPERLLFSVATSHSDHMLSYQQADLCLDPWPHGGGVVSLEQLYQGVPLITRYGKQPAGRNTASILTAIGRTEWIAKDAAEYVEKAVEWSERTKELADARKTLRRELLESPVVVGYVEAVEAAYLKIFQEWCSK